MLLAPPPSLIYESSYRSASSPLCSSMLCQTIEPHQAHGNNNNTKCYIHNDTHYSMTPPINIRSTRQHTQPILRSKSSNPHTNDTLLQACSALQRIDDIHELYLKLSEYVVYLAQSTSCLIAHQDAISHEWIQECTSYRHTPVYAPWLRQQSNNNNNNQQQPPQHSHSSGTLETIPDSISTTSTRNNSRLSSRHVSYRSELDNDISLTIQSRSTSINSTSASPLVSSPRTLDLQQKSAAAQANDITRQMPLTLFERCIDKNECIILAGNSMYNDKSKNSMAIDPYFIYCFTERVDKQAPRSVAAFPLHTSIDITTTLDNNHTISHTVIYLENCYSTTAFTPDRIHSLQLLINTAQSQLNILLQQQHIRQLQNELKNKELLCSNIQQQAKDQVTLAQQQANNKTVFLSNMSHELRTPLNSVLGVVRLLASTDLNNEQMQYVDMLNSSGQLLLSIISDILDFNKIDSNRLELEQREFNLLDCIETSMNMLYDMAVQKNLDLSYSIGQNVPRYIVGDSVRLQQIFLNLCSNSIKFGRQGYVLLSVDTVDMTNHELQPHTLNNDNNNNNNINNNNNMMLYNPCEYVKLQFSVADDGIGIAKDMQSKLFTSFTQAEHSTNRRFGGTGLGLAISKRLANAMNGDMWVDSQEGVGSIFTFTVVLKRAIQHDPYHELHNLHDLHSEPDSGSDDLHSTQDTNSDQDIASDDINNHNNNHDNATSNNNNNSLTVSVQSPIVYPNSPHTLKQSQSDILNNKRVLIVSDAYASTQQLISMLKPHNVHITTVHDTSSAIQHLLLVNRTTPRHSTQHDNSSIIDIVNNTDCQNNDNKFDFQQTYHTEQQLQQQHNKTNKVQQYDLIIHSAYKAETSPQQLTGNLMRRLTFSQLPYTVLFIHAGRAARRASNAIDASNSSPQLTARQIDRLQLVEVTKPIKQRHLLKTIIYLLQHEHTGINGDINENIKNEQSTTHSPCNTNNTLRHSGTHNSSSRSSYDNTASIMPDTDTEFQCIPADQLESTVVATSVVRDPNTSPSLRRTSLPISVNTNHNHDHNHNNDNDISLNSNINKANNNNISTPTSIPSPSIRTDRRLLHARTMRVTNNNGNNASNKTNDSTSSNINHIKRMASDAPLRILLAEDNIVGQKMLLMMLSKLGYSNVDTAQNGDDVLKLLTTNNCSLYDVILMDINMSPGMDGLSCTRIIRQHGSICNVHCNSYIIAQTANVSTEFQQECIQAGMNDWLSKPVVLEQLILTLQRAYKHKCKHQLDDIRENAKNNNIQPAPFKINDNN